MTGRARLVPVVTVALEHHYDRNDARAPHTGAWPDPHITPHITPHTAETGPHRFAAVTGAKPWHRSAGTPNKRGSGVRLAAADGCGRLGDLQGSGAVRAVA